MALFKTGHPSSSAPSTAGPGGWWIITEVSVSYALHQCPSHDIPGWRKERMPERPRGVIDMTPDWVCEIVSPDHERKDTLALFLLLRPTQAEGIRLYFDGSLSRTFRRYKLVKADV